MYSDQPFVGGLCLTVDLSYQQSAIRCNLSKSSINTIHPMKVGDAWYVLNSKNHFSQII